MYIIRRIITKAANLKARLVYRFGGNDALFKPLLPFEAKKGQPRLIAFGCLGNICRSPYAHNRLNQLLDQRQIPAIEVQSFGIETTPGLSADKVATRIAQTRGLDLTRHNTSRIDPALLTRADLILVMEPMHLRRIRSIAPEAISRTLLLGALNVPYGGDAVIEDPFGQTDTVFEKCFRQIDQALGVLVDRL